MGKDGWALRVGLTSPRQAELFRAVVGSFPGMMDEMFDSEPFGEEQMLADHTFNDLLTGRLIQKVSESDKWTYFELTKASELAPTFTKVAQELHSQYVIGFTPMVLDNKVHKLAVKMKQPGMTAQARRSYLAAGDKMSVSGK